MSQFFDILNFPSVSRGVWCIWRRNFLYFKRSALISILWVFVEPMLYLVAVGLGVGAMIGKIEDRTYLEFFIPGLAASSAMLISFFESTYGSYTKLNKTEIFSALVTTPLMPGDIVLGEIFWGATKGMWSASAVLLVGLLMKALEFPAFVAALPIIFLTATLFSSFGLLMATYVRSYDSFIYAQTGFIIPMYLFSGTYFPLSSWPDQIQWLCWLFPLTHAVEAIRAFCYGVWDIKVLLQMAYLFALSFFFISWSSSRIEKKLLS